MKTRQLSFSTDDKITEGQRAQSGHVCHPLTGAVQERHPGSVWNRSNADGVRVEPLNN